MGLFRKKNPCRECGCDECPRRDTRTFRQRVRDFCYVNEGAFVAVDLFGVLLLVWMLGVAPFSYADAELPELFPKAEMPAGAETDYYRNALDAREQAVYDQLEAAYRSLAGSVRPQEPLSQDDVIRISSFVLYDNPDIWWAETAPFCLSNIWGVTSVGLGYYERDPNRIAAKSAEYGQLADDVVDEVRQESGGECGDAEMASAVFTWVAEHCHYAEDVHASQNIDSVFDDGATVCSGYSKTYKYILDKAGVPCVFVVGGSSREGDSNHAWNIVRAQDSPVYVDLTWADRRDGDINWKWFASPAESFASGHWELYSEELAAFEEDGWEPGEADELSESWAEASGHGDSQPEEGLEASEEGARPETDLGVH